MLKLLSDSKKKKSKNKKHEETNRLYNVVVINFYGAALLTKLYTQHAQRSDIDSENQFIEISLLTIKY